MHIAAIDSSAGCHTSTIDCGDASNPCRTGHVSDDVEPFLDVNAKSQVQVPVELEPNTAIHRQAQARHTNIKTKI